MHISTGPLTDYTNSTCSAMETCAVKWVPHNFCDDFNSRVGLEPSDYWQLMHTMCLSSWRPRSVTLQSLIWVAIVPKHFHFSVITLQLLVEYLGGKKFHKRTCCILLASCYSLNSVRAIKGQILSEMLDCNVRWLILYSYESTWIQRLRGVTQYFCPYGFSPLLSTGASVAPNQKKSIMLNMRSVL